MEEVSVKRSALRQGIILEDTQVVSVADVGRDAVEVGDNDSRAFSDLIDDLTVWPRTRDEHNITVLITMILVHLESELSILICFGCVTKYQPCI